ncbi:hypothetical protein [Polyangium sp. 15x6]|uniref:hypothetical protein n=1 Tax=Polyangium sp. 15x6 TaxID=3042687 RepID=UPI00249A997D|nr:hypothetical protein [Polyangium sp. 15x6]MDI3287395.1 hypothetical protein [Polyangium sp. 15x6]
MLSAVLLLLGLGVANVVMILRYQRRMGANMAKHSRRFDLESLVPLLPDELRQQPFIGVREHHRDGRIFVGLLLPSPDAKRKGNPENVGLEFDAETGRLIAIHPEGVALGIK